MSKSTNKSKKIVISTIGDSLTEGSGKESTISDQPEFPFQYQNYLYQYLASKNIPCSVKNWGIGGQIISKICSRMHQTIPADYIVTMGGTNDVWRYADIDEGIEEEICESLLELYEDAVPKTLADQEKAHGFKPYIFVCSIPPFGDVSTLPKNGRPALQYINQKIKEWVESKNNSHILFCDVHKAMENENKYMKKGLAILDGVHFTKEGNKACGEAIATCILNHVQKNT